MFTSADSNTSDPKIEQPSLLVRAEGSSIPSAENSKTKRSRQSIRRFIKLLLGINHPQHFFHQTLTFNEIITDELIARKALKKLLDSLVLAFPRLAVIWIQENQDRGAIHYHLILLFFGQDHPPSEGMREQFRKEVFSRWNKLNSNDLHPNANRMTVQKLDGYTVGYYLKKITVATAKLKREPHWFGVRRGKLISANSTAVTSKTITKLYSTYFRKISKRERELTTLPLIFTERDMRQTRELVELMGNTDWEGHKCRALGDKTKVSNRRFCNFMNRERDEILRKYDKPKTRKPDF